MSSSLEGKTWEMDGCLGPEIEGIDETLDSSLDEIMLANEEQTWSGWRAVMMICFSFKALRKIECLFLEHEKIVLTLNTFLIVVSFFYAEVSVHDSMDSAVRILER